MPLYDYHSDRCDRDFEEMRTIEERGLAICPGCNGRAKQILKPGHGGLSLFKPGYWRDIDFDPIYIESPQHLRKELDARDARAPYLENGPWRTSPEATKEELSGKGSKSHHPVRLGRNVQGHG